VFRIYTMQVENDNIFLSRLRAVVVL